LYKNQNPKSCIEHAQFARNGCTWLNQPNSTLTLRLLGGRNYRPARPQWNLFFHKHQCRIFIYRLVA